MGISFLGLGEELQHKGGFHRHGPTLKHELTFPAVCDQVLKSKLELGDIRLGYRLACTADDRQSVFDLERIAIQFCIEASYAGGGPKLDTHITSEKFVRIDATPLGLTSRQVVAGPRPRKEDVRRANPPAYLCHWKLTEITLPRNFFRIFPE